uniref:Uncharacterized protein n=1 Tax=Panagrolaimus superbus TaxID=310955 RepID=A0A914YEX2_9BILA
MLKHFYEFLKKNKCMVVTLIFRATISEEYKIRLDKITDKLLESNPNEYFPFAFTYLGQSYQKKKLLFDKLKKNMHH